MCYNFKENSGAKGLMLVLCVCVCVCEEMMLRTVHVEGGLKLFKLPPGFIKICAENSYTSRTQAFHYTCDVIFCLMTYRNGTLLYVYTFNDSRVATLFCYSHVQFFPVHIMKE